MMKRIRVRMGAAAGALALICFAGVGARAQQEPASSAPPGDVFSSSTSTYTDASSASCEESKNANNPYAGMNPLVCYGVSLGVDSNGQCSLQGMTLWKQEGGTCYYCQPINPPTKGFLVPMDQLALADNQGFLCGVDQADPSCFAVCTGNGTFNPPGGVRTDSTPAPQPSNGKTPVLQGHISTSACEPFGPGGYNYCDNPQGTQPAGCVCPQLKPETPSEAQPPANNGVDPGQYLQGIVDGIGSCIQSLQASFTGLIAGAGYFAQGNFVEAADVWGLQPGQSIYLRAFYADMTTPIIGANVTPYSRGMTDGKRICQYILLPAAKQAAGAAIKGAASATQGPSSGGTTPRITGPSNSPAQLPSGGGGTPPQPPGGGGPPSSNPPAVIPKTGTLPAAPSGSGTVPAAPGGAPSLGPVLAPLIEGVAAGSSPAVPLSGSVFQDYLNTSPKGLPGKWVDLPSGPVQLGAYIDQGSFADVYENGNKVIKLSRTDTKAAGYGPDSIAGQNQGYERLKGTDVLIPEVLNYQPGNANSPASLVADNARTAFPGFKPISPADFRKMQPAQQSGVLKAMNNLTNAIAQKGFVLGDTNTGNIWYKSEGGTYQAMLVDTDMIMTPAEVQAATKSGSVPGEVVYYGLLQAKNPTFLQQPWTVESLTNVLNQGRANRLYGR